MDDPGVALRGDILARLLLVQTTAAYLPDETSIIDFVCRGLEAVPGIETAQSVAPGDSPSAVDDTAENHRLSYGDTIFGNVRLKLGSRRDYAPYEPHVQNLLYVIGLMLEERRQRRLAEEYRRNLERRVDERTAALAAEKELLDVTLRSIGDGVIATDTHRVILVMNAVAESLTECVAEEVIGSYLAESLVVIDSRTSARTDDPVARVLSTEKVVDFPDYLLLVARSGVQRAVSLTASPIRHHDGGILGVVLVLRDVTEKNRLVEQTQRAERLDAIGILAGGIAHDFNNLLGGIFGYVSLAREQAIVKSPQAATLDEALQIFERARDLTRQLLTFAKGGAPVRSVIDLRKLLNDCTRFALSGSNVASQLHLPTELPNVAADANQIWRVIDNLVRNAVQAMPRGGTLTVTGDAVRINADDLLQLAAGAYVRICVEDNGPGIAADLLPRIFDPFFTTKEQGSGLGLATAYSVVKRHDGHISVKSQLGVGTTFTIYLPVASSAVRSLSPVPTKAKHRGSGRALVLDDEAYLGRLFMRLLGGMGYEVTVVSDGREAIAAVDTAIAEERPFRFALLDLTIPGGMGGKDAVTEIRLKCPNIVAIAASGYSADPIMAYPEQYGFDASLEKPFGKPELEALLSALITEP